jgi:hypothetical protein
MTRTNPNRHAKHYYDILVERWVPLFLVGALFLIPALVSLIGDSPLR